MLGEEEFKSIFRKHPGAVSVITFCHHGESFGFTATSVISVSAEPARVAFSVLSSSSSWRALAETESVVINFLSADQVEISTRFATRRIDRFAGLEWVTLPTGEPVLAGSASWLRGTVVERTPAGSSYLVQVEPLEAVLNAQGAEPLIYHDRRYRTLGEVL